MRVLALVPSVLLKNKPGHLVVVLGLSISEVFLRVSVPAVTLAVFLLSSKFPCQCPVCSWGLCCVPFF